MNLHNGTNVTFERNRADTVGGAILVDNPTLIQDTNPLFNSLCFFQYKTEMENAKGLTPKEWEVCVCVCVCVCVDVDVKEPTLHHSLFCVFGGGGEGLEDRRLR